MNVEISKQEAWRLIDAIKSYTKDYAVNGSVEKTFSNIMKKLQVIIKE